MGSDVGMLVDEEEGKERLREMKGLCCFFILLFTTSAHLFLAFTFRNTKRFEITNQRHLYTPIARFSPTSNAIFPNLKNGTIFGSVASRPYTIKDDSPGRGQDAAQDAQAVDAS